MPRPVDHGHREQLLTAAVDYVITHGLADLSWRPLARALGVTPNTLVHHFGTKEQLLEAILRRVREHTQHATTSAATGAAATEARTPEDALRSVWAWASAPEHRPLFRLFFAVYGLALQDPDRYSRFLDHVMTDWMDELAGLFPATPQDPDATLRRTMYIATVRGLLLDLLTTGDEQRTTRAFTELLSSILQRS